MSLRIFLLVAAFLLPALPAHAAPHPGFALGFTFRPSLASSSYQAVTLDICADSGCGALIASIPMQCQARPNRAGIVGLTHCAARALARPRRPDVNFGLLNHPVTFRLRSGSALSQPIGFPGGLPSVPHTVYCFTVSPGPQGFMVQPS